MSRARLALAACLALGTLGVTAAPAGAAPQRAPQQSTLAWGPCEEDVDPEFECTTLAVPLDYANPGGETIGIALIRLPAAGQREGAVLMNPGGPGGSGYDLVANAGAAIHNSMVGLDRFDIIGFDPRGVDRSGGIRCLDDAQVDATLYADDTPESIAEAVALAAGELAFPRACVAEYGDTLRHYSTEATARDMDSIRVALGDAQISYIGISYGTYLGAVYATLFPDQVRSMVLDAAAQYVGRTEFEQYATQAIGFENAFANWAAWCEETSECAFTAVDVAGRWDALLARLDTTPLVVADGREVNHVAMETATVSALYSETAWPELGAALAEAEAGDGQGLLDLADDYEGRNDDGTFDTLFQSFFIIRCASGIDAAVPADPEALLAEIRAAAPRFSRDMGLVDFYDLCGEMLPSDVEPVVPSYTGSAPILVVGGMNDPATPFELAEELTAMMGPNARLLAYSGEGHGQILASDCVTDIEAATIATLSLPVAGTVCDPDPDVPRPVFWDQLPVPAGVGAPLTDPTIAGALGLPPDDAYTEAWAMTGDAASVIAGYEQALPAAGFQVVGTRDDIIDGATLLQTFGPDGVFVVVLVVPADALATSDDLDGLADAVPAGQGLVVVAALAE
ncbi:alpha/beta fold hydrolase [Desertimonas flava]|uniref:alpha/beta fold hydrolase n=1 Tax=Desertimonas flava TaxID=2064846 RepID=UPI000E3517AD|nr:alpha/beta fold hydrolase [Desertimonas flava]